MSAGLSYTGSLQKKGSKHPTSARNLAAIPQNATHIFFSSGPPAVPNSSASSIHHSEISGTTTSAVTSQVNNCIFQPTPDVCSNLNAANHSHVNLNTGSEVVPHRNESCSASGIAHVFDDVEPALYHPCRAEDEQPLLSKLDISKSLVVAQKALPSSANCSVDAYSDDSDDGSCSVSLAAKPTRNTVQSNVDVIRSQGWHTKPQNDPATVLAQQRQVMERDAAFQAAIEDYFSRDYEDNGLSLMSVAQAHDLSYHTFMAALGRACHWEGAVIGALGLTSVYKQAIQLLMEGSYASLREVTAVVNAQLQTAAAGSGSNSATQDVKLNFAAAPIPGTQIQYSSLHKYVYR